MTLDLTEVSDRELVWEIYRRIKGDSEQHYHRRISWGVSRSLARLGRFSAHRESQRGKPSEEGFVSQ